MKILVYTAITGNYDEPRDDIRVETLDLFKDPMRSARMHKCLPPDFDEYDFSIWVDGNTALKVAPEEIIKELGDADILVYSHWRDCVHDEATAETEECIALGKPQEEIDVIATQMGRYRKEKYPEHSGLAATTYVIRRHNERVRQFNYIWWAEICMGSKQDQLSFNYACRKAGVKLKYFEEKHFDIHKINNYFKYKPHL